MKRMMTVLIIMVMLASTTSCNKEEKTISAIGSPNYPKSVSFDDFDENKKIRNDNPVDDAFLLSLKDFSYRTAYQILSQSKGNVNYSPLSLYYALALAGTGAEGKTKDELLQLLGTQSSELSKQCGNLYRLLYKDNEISKLKIANSLWLHNEVRFKEAYIDNAVDNFYSSLFNLNLSDPLSKDLMTKWITENTNGLISPDIKINPEQIMSIINTIYYYDEWVDRFDKKKTAPDQFYPDASSKVTCDFMNRTFASHSFLDGDGFTRSYLNLKNKGNMVFILPDEGIDIEELLSRYQLSDLFEEENSHHGKVIYQIPKFSLDSRLELPDMLKDLGVQTVFQKDADFSNITDGLAYISSITQQTHLSIDENGVEAAAFTELDYAGASMPNGTAQMILNRPFIYGIKNNGVLLFIGICNNPSNTEPVSIDGKTSENEEKPDKTTPKVSIGSPSDINSDNNDKNNNYDKNDSNDETGIEDNNEVDETIEPTSENLVEYDEANFKLEDL
ncbi:serpin family protein [Mobilitalea sibirica]|uniref:Serpin family protein n=1 Tax=Mobilitalea sibirica TaxID=1462919 RepID=A0A8J7KWM0_9FIRM|nr:serpin family protein [Mobilitalea sibirica]MBH1941500.1 serpin family protein [Mobilitalea sibirica]